MYGASVPQVRVKSEVDMKKAIYKSYGKKGEDIVNMNYAEMCIRDRG